MSHHSPYVSADLIWEVTRNQNAFLVKRTTGGGVRFSKDPLNLTNLHSRKAAGVAPAEKGGVTLITKKSSATHSPATSLHKTTFGKNKSNRKVYAGIAKTVAKNSYRPDLRAAAVSRASAILESQTPKKDAPEPKLRGSKAKKAAAEKEE
ncbi:60S ribosomal L28 protein [Rutstroemia sp. NJR-2017a WRK4]|nr:60S ribosomal L28 protein [Rutstroemia sp. NJR-2017a WRK4]PQE11892.1 60S ribosomal L28 protein [Rutstroemia sp. NJR-2017a WRK4]PQE13911.1 60S ribosomal L28 protein [Rutstroemia sp. NJR-2017a BBW]